jgi:dTDP-glucose pyrophosphorylase
MLRVHGKPILEHILEGLLAAGIHDVCLVTGWQAEVIENHFGNGSRFGARIACIRQTVQDGTGRAAGLARDWVGTDSFLLTYGDILVKPETYAQLVDRFAAGVFSGAVTVTVGEDVSKGGINFFDERFCLRRLVEKPTAAQIDQLRTDGWLRPGEPLYYNAGIYIFRHAVFDYIARLRPSPRGEYELTDAIIDMLNDQHQLAGLKIEGRWVDVRDTEILRRLDLEQQQQQQ